MNDVIEELLNARTEHNRLRREVESWMDNEGRNGRLRQNNHAPMWPDYESALARWQQAVAGLDAHIAKPLDVRFREARERRAQDLSNEEREALRRTRARFNPYVPLGAEDEVAVLDKLLGGKP